MSGGQQGHPGDVAGVVGGVSAAQHQLSLVLGRVAEIEGELGALNQTLGDEVVERGGTVVCRQRAEGHAEDAIELAQLVRGAEADGIGHLRELLVLHDQAAEVEVVHGLVAGYRARAVGDVEKGAVSGIGGGLGGVILGVATATGVTVGRRDPKVETSGIEEHVELLNRGADSDLAVVLTVFIFV